MDVKVYKTLESNRRAQASYMARLKRDDIDRWSEMCKNQRKGGNDSVRRIYANPEENKDRLERLRAQKREYARKKREDKVYREACNSWQREYRLKKKLNESNISKK